MAIESSLRNMVIVLFAVCLVASAALGGIYTLTKEPIEAAQVAKTNRAVSKVYVAKKGDEIVGYAIESSTSKGFSGNITIMVGFAPDGTIVNTSVISHAETPGLGAKIANPEDPFIVQFAGMNPGSPDFKLAVRKDGGNVDAITASTITSRAFCDAVNTAYKVFCKINESGEAQE